MNSNDMDKWLSYEGKKFLKAIGIRKDQFILDFGCGHGTYTIPASLVVGKKGKIYAVDKNTEYLDELMQKARIRGLDNIERIDMSEERKLPLSDEWIDMVLLYDVLHLVESRERTLVELYRVLKPYGVLSVYPKHHQEEMNMDLEEVKVEIEATGFSFDLTLYKTLMHDDQLEKGYVLNFRKI
jgi:ubiquinone/menaquinone biosynthesis C-methylase UbiE